MIEQLETNPQADASAWLMDMDLVNNPAALNALLLNILVGFKGVKDAQLVIDTNNKKILVFLELSWYYARFKFKETSLQVTDIISQALPAWRFRVTYDRTILAKAVALIRSDRILK